MANDINKVFIIGRITRDIELKATSSGAHFARFSIASNRSVKTGDEWKDEAGFFDCVAWGKTAESIQRFFSKGSRIIIDGSLRWSSWEADGQKRSKVEILVESFNFGDSKKSGDAPQGEAVAAAFNSTDESIPF